jgi:hypothetical protein
VVTRLQPRHVWHLFLQLTRFPSGSEHRKINTVSQARPTAQIVHSGTASKAHAVDRAAVQIGGSSARSNAAVLTQRNRFASGPVLTLIPAEAGMPAYADVLRGRIECAAAV